MANTIEELRALVDELHTQLAANQQAWEGEEDSVQEEHDELIAANAALLARLEKA